MEKEELKMKSIFNVYRGAQLKSLESAETILNKLIFNEKPFCVRVQQSGGWQRKNKLEALSNDCRAAERLRSEPAFTSKAAPLACVVRPHFVHVDHNDGCVKGV